MSYIPPKALREQIKNIRIEDSVTENLDEVCTDLYKNHADDIIDSLACAMVLMSSLGGTLFKDV